MIFKLSENLMLIKIISIVSQITIFNLMLSLGLSISFNHLRFINHHRNLTLKSLVIIDIITPLCTLLIVNIFQPSVNIGFALILIVASPAPPLTSLKVIQSLQGNIPYAISLHLILAAISFITTPLSLKLLIPLFHYEIVEFQVNSLDIAKQVAISQLIPIGLGMIIKEKFPDFANKVVNTLKKVSNFFFLGLVLLVLFFSFKSILQIGFYAIITITIVGITLIAIGHIFGGPDRQNRITLALISITRNFGLAFLIAAVNFSKKQALGPLLSVTVIFAIVGLIYLKLYIGQSRRD